MTDRRKFLLTAASGVAALPLIRRSFAEAPKAGGLKLLILGGTNFLGPQIVEAATRRGHTMTLFNRGKTHPGLFPDLEKLHGDRKTDMAKDDTFVDEPADKLYNEGLYMNARMRSTPAFSQRGVMSTRTSARKGACAACATRPSKPPIDAPIRIGWPGEGGCAACRAIRTRSSTSCGKSYWPSLFQSLSP